MEIRYLGGLTEIAETLGVSERALRHDRDKALLLIPAFRQGAHACPVRLGKTVLPGTGPFDPPGRKHPMHLTAVLEAAMRVRFGRVWPSDALPMPRDRSAEGRALLAESGPEGLAAVFCLCLPPVYSVAQNLAFQWRFGRPSTGPGVREAPVGQR